MIDTREHLRGYDATVDADAYYFDPARAQHAIDWIERHCTHVRGALGGQPFWLEVWQQAYIGTLFGWYDRETGARRYRETFLYIPRKNGKSPLGAAIALYIIDTDDEPGYEAVSAAGDKEQAAKSYEYLTGMIRNDEHLASRYRVYKSPRHIVPYHDQVSSFRVLSSDAETKHGGNLNLVLFDELHIQKNRELFDVLAQGTAARRQPLIISMTTADSLRDSICNEKLDFSRKVIGGIVSAPQFLPVLFHADPDDDWRDMATWRKANPNLGVSLQPDYVAQEIARAEATPSLLPNLKRYHLNIQTSTVDTWIDLDAWMACPREQTFAGPCLAGLDLASRDDLTAFVCYWPETGAVRAWYFAPSYTVDLQRNSHYRRWAEAGDLIVTPGDVTDFAAVRRQIVAADREHRIDRLGFDPYAANEITTNLHNYDGIPTVGVPFTMRHISEAAKLVEIKIRRGELAHGHHAITTWMATNATVKIDDNDNILPSKKYSSGKIDGIAALCVAQAVAIATPDAGSIYEERGILAI